MAVDGHWRLSFDLVLWCYDASGLMGGSSGVALGSTAGVGQK